MPARSVFKKVSKRIGRAFGFSETLDNLTSINNRLTTLESQLNSRFDALENKSSLQFNSTLDKIRRLEKINELYFDALFSKESESPLEMRKRFFKKLPQATGNLFLIQQGCIKMLRELDSICKKNNITYWISDGTLLGAVRHGGMIPWDDDIDTYMLRDDIAKLEQATKNTDYKVNIAFDPYVVSRQVRFMSRDVNNPCFVDIFIFDFGTNGSMSDWQRWLKLRKKITTETQTSKDTRLIEWQNKGVINANDNSALSKYLAKYYDNVFGGINKNIKEGGPLGIVASPKEDQEVFIVDGLDNLYPVANPNSPRIYSHDDIFPLQTILYEGMTLPCPNHTDKYLSDMYGDIYSIPSDLVSHYRHVDIDSSKKKVIVDFLKKHN